MRDLLAKEPMRCIGKKYHSPNQITLSEDPNRSLSFISTHNISCVVLVILIPTIADGGLNAHTITMRLNVVNPKASLSA